MNVYRKNPMTTRPSFAKFLPTVLTILMLGSSAKVFADDQAEPAKEQAVAPAAAPAEPAKSATSPAPASEAAVAGSASAEPPKPVGEAQPALDSPAVAEIGIQRLPGSAYPTPQTRGLLYGSLWLTFHGLQWPYMPATAKGSRFVVGISGWGWVDTSYETFKPSASDPNNGPDSIKYWKQQSRLLLRVTPTYSLDDNWFVQGQVELVGTEDQTASRGDVGGADTDDLWLRIGQWNKWDFQVGRYEGWEVFHLGMGLDQNTFERLGAVGPGESNYGISFYGLTDNQFRPQGAAGNFAVHYYPLRILRVELLGMAGSLSGPAYATRPVAILDLGWLKLKGGAEYQKVVAQQNDQTSKVSKGVGGAVQFVFEPHIEFGLNAAQGTVWDVDNKGQLNTAGSFTRTSFGGFANISNGSAKHPLIFGVGGLYTHTEDQNDQLHNGVVDKYWLFQGFAAIQYVAFQQLYIKLVGGYSRGHWLVAGTDPATSFDNEMYSVRLRFSFYF
jgi:hypothetical protein